jgi:hypothetical protein
MPTSFSAAEYRALIKGRRLTERTRGIGYDLFVRRQSPADIRARYSITPSRLHGIRRQIEMLWLESQLTDEWFLETVVAPRHLLDDLRRQVARLTAPASASPLFAEAEEANRRRASRKKR